MEVLGWILVAVIVLLILFLAFKGLKSCLPKILLGLFILAAIAFVVYWFLIR